MSRREKISGTSIVFASLGYGLEIPNAAPLKNLRAVERKLPGGRRKKRKKDRPKAPTRYQDYIKSRFWTRRKNRYYREHGRRCAVCGASRHVNLHHKRYGNYGAERDEDLIPLCGRHHIGFHAKHGVKRDMRDDTAEYVHGAAFEEEAERVMRGIQ